MCVVTVDGADLRCLSVPGYSYERLIGWGALHELVGEYSDSVGVSWIFAVDVRSNTHRLLAEGQGLALSRAVGWFACLCRRTPSEPYGAMLLNAGPVVQAIRLERADMPPTIGLFTAGRDHYLDRFEIQRIPEAIPLDVNYDLRVKGWDPGGRPLEPFAVRWWSADTTVALVSNTGVLTPRRLGTAVVWATSGGWRTDSLRVTIGPARHRLVLDENWKRGITAAWRPFGQPRPFVFMSGGRSSLATNGDSSFASGVLSSAKFATREGVGVQFTMSVPVTLLQWQYLGVFITGVDSMDIGSWDLDTGNVPFGEWKACGVHYPVAHGDFYLSHLTLAAGLRRVVRGPPGLPRGDWVNVWIQYLPDGRCGVAINGTAAAMVERPLAMGDSAVLVIGGYSHRTRILVGPVRVWTGVRAGIDWNSVAASPVGRTQP